MRHWKALLALKQYQLRGTGFTLVAIGFAWLLFVQLSIRPIARAIVVTRYESIDPNKRFTAEDVQNQVRLSTFELVNKMPFIIGPGIVMGMGAILLGDASRKVRIDSPSVTN
ncbi:MAG TPA: hypothetical protein VM735_13660 [Candidatus Kapabacteria bacterium]|nr:hypothetical protein [Candidatus Kapabacteria bacterium]